MTQQDPFNPRPQRPPDIDPPLTGSRRQDINRSDWNSGVIASAIVAAVIVIGLIVWASTGQQTATNPPPQTTGQGTNPPPAAK